MLSAIIIQRAAHCSKARKGQQHDLRSNLSTAPLSDSLTSLSARDLHGYFRNRRSRFVFALKWSIGHEPQPEKNDRSSSLRPILRSELSCHPATRDVESLRPQVHSVCVYFRSGYRETHPIITQRSKKHHKRRKDDMMQLSVQNKHVSNDAHYTHENTYISDHIKLNRFASLKYRPMLQRSE